MIQMTQKEFDDLSSLAEKEVYLVTYHTWEGPEFVAVCHSHESAQAAIEKNHLEYKSRDLRYYDIDLEKIQ